MTWIPTRACFPQSTNRVRLRLLPHASRFLLPQLRRSRQVGGQPRGPFPPPAAGNCTHAHMASTPLFTKKGSCYIIGVPMAANHSFKSFKPTPVCGST